MSTIYTGLLRYRDLEPEIDPASRGIVATQPGLIVDLTLLYMYTV
jgi:hypothetical protein